MAVGKNQSQNEEVANVNELEPVALSLFSTMLASNTSYETETIAARAFSAAKVFVEESRRIRDGGKVWAEPKNRKIQIWIHAHDPVTDQPSYNENGEPVWYESQGDPYSYAPNKKPEHPVNQAFYLARHELGMEIPDRFKSALKAALAEREGRVFVSSKVN
jgi:hypothetical protein